MSALNGPEETITVKLDTLKELRVQESMSNQTPNQWIKKWFPQWLTRTH